MIFLVADNMESEIHDLATPSISAISLSFNLSAYRIQSLRN